MKEWGRNGQVHAIRAVEETCGSILSGDASNIADRFLDVAKKCTHPLSVEFLKVLVECAELHAKKGADYGRDEDPFSNVRASEEFGIPGWKGSVLRGNDKMSRLKTYSQKGSLENEGVEDSLQDLVNYAAIGLVLFREENRTA